MYIIKQEILKVLPTTMLSLLVVLNPAYVKAQDSTTLRPPGTAHMVYQAYVNTRDCIPTEKKVWVVVGGVGGGKPDQQCPDHHPVMYGYNQTMAYTTFMPWAGAVMGAGGDTTAQCCAVAYQWVPTPSPTS